jgi:glycosyltransferase involved in cell wall biosynthesis
MILRTFVICTSLTLSKITLRIALIHYRLVLKGGLETRLRNYISYFIENSHEVTVFCAKISEEVVLPGEVKIVRVKPGFVPKVLRKVFFDIKLGKMIKNQNYDFSLSLGRTSHQDAVLAPSNHLGYLRSLNRKARSINDWRQIYLDKKSYRDSKIIYACSQMMKDELIELFNVPEKKIKVLFPPLNTDVFVKGLKNKQLEMKQKFGMNPDKTTFVFVSTSHKRKGLDLLQKVFSQLDMEKYELFVAGDSFRAASKNIKHVGYVRETWQLYTAADFTVHPAIYEPFGQIISESLACQTPVIISHMVGAKEILDENIGLVVNNFNVKTWKETIEILNTKQFNISDDFAFKKGLSLEQHVRKMLEEWEKFLAKSPRRKER